MTRGAIVFGSVMIVLAILIVATGCAGVAATPAPAATTATAGSPAAAAQNKEPIKIGYFGQLSAPHGKSNSAALEISVADMNKGGGILGRPVELIIEDSKGQLPLALAAYKKLVMTDKCLAVVTEGTDAAIACMEEGSKLYAEHPHLQFSVWAAADEMTDRVRADKEKYKHFFLFHMRVGSLYDERINLWSMFTDTLKTKKLALVMEDMTWTEPLAEGIAGKYPSMKEEFEHRGIEVVYYAKSAANEKMFLPMLEQIAASGADTIYWVTGVTDTATLAKQWAESAAKDINLASMSAACSYASFWGMTDGAALGWVAQFPEIDIPFTDRTVPFLDELEAKGAGILSSTYGACDSPWVLKAAVEKVGDTKDVDALIAAMETVEAQYAFWKWKFDEFHDPVKGDPYFPMIHGQFQENGKFVVVDSEDLRKLTNPDDKFIPVKELRAKAGQ